jgi:sn-glycerol 3-phosphate transport system substrate-binding protein
MKRFLTSAIAALVVATGCGGGNTGNAAANPLDDKASPPPGVIEIQFWHGFSAGANQDATNYLVQQFNTQNQGKIKVTATYAGNYDDTFAKYKASIQSNQLPDMLQIYDIGTRFMIDSGTIQPMQLFIDHDKFSTSDLEPNLLGYFSISGKLYSMPWNNSTPLLYYNKDAFTKAGLDPNRPPKTLAEIRDYAQKLTIKDAAGNTTQYGFGATIYGWFLEQLTASADQQLCNNGNGRDKPATKVNFNQPTEVQIVDWWRKMVADGLALNTGRSTTDAQNAFKAGRMAINLESTGVMRGYQSSVKFGLGAGFFPRPIDTTAGGTIIGGASLWIVNKKPSYVQKAAWEFVKFLEQPQSMVYWHTHTGYFPISKSAQSDPVDVQWRQQYPQFQVAIDQLHQTKLDKATQGCLLGVMPAARQAAESGMESAITGKATPQKAMDDAVASLQPQIDSYNQSVGVK